MLLEKNGNSGYLQEKGSYIFHGSMMSLNVNTADSVKFTYYVKHYERYRLIAGILLSNYNQACELLNITIISTFNSKEYY